ncbi:MAG: hypothetical protein ACRD2T_02565, partial [Thermoanaerobaculia bacterium]
MLLGCAACAPLAAQDLLILRDGARKTGKLQVCAGEVCRLGAESVPRAAIAWIGLATDAAQPPGTEAGDTDEVHLRGGSVERGSFVGLSLGAIAFAHRSFDRDQVAWIHLGLKTPEDRAPTGAEEAEPSTTKEPAGPPPESLPPQLPPSDEAPPSEPQKPSPPSPPPGPRGEAVTPCAPDEPLGGHVRIEARYEQTRGAYSEIHLQGHARYWFRLRPMWATRGWRDALTSVFAAEDLVYDLRSSECVDVSRPDEVCSCPARGLSGRAALETSDDSGWVRFEPLVPRLEVNLPVSVAQAGEIDGECRETGGSGGGTGIGLTPAKLTHSTTFEVTAVCHEETRFCVPSLGCEDAKGDRLPDCSA